MAINRQKISQMTPKGADLDPTDLLEVSVDTGSGYETYSITGQEIINGAGAALTEITIDTKTLQYTLVLGDNYKMIELNFSAGNNIIIPTNAAQAFPIGTQILLSQYGAGQVTVVPDTGVTVRSSGGKTKTAAQYAVATLIKRGTDEWYLAGDLTT